MKNIILVNTLIATDKGYLQMEAGVWNVENQREFFAFESAAEEINLS